MPSEAAETEESNSVYCLLSINPESAKLNKYWLNAWTPTFARCASVVRELIIFSIWQHTFKNN